MRPSIRQIIVENAPFWSRDMMLLEIQKVFDFKRHSIMDAFRRLKLDGTVEEWCDGSITLAGHNGLK